MKLVWRVEPAPTGRYKSFESRAWPSCYDGDPNEADSHVIATIINVDKNDYHPSLRNRTDLRLKVRVYDYREGVCNRKVKFSAGVFGSIQECKDWIDKMYKGPLAGWLPEVNNVQS